MQDKPKLLLVENDYITAFIALQYFEKFFQCTHVSGAVAALKSIKQQSFDLVLLDINLGDSSLDGTSVLQTMRKDPVLQQMKICAFTSYSLPDAEKRFRQLGFDEYIQKCTDYQEIAQKLALSLENGTEPKGAS